MHVGAAGAGLNRALALDGAGKRIALVQIVKERGGMDMRSTIILALAALASAAAAEQPPIPDDPKGWQALASRDLDGMREALKANSPIFVVDRDSAPLRAWADEGYAEARRKLPLVKDATSAKDLLSYYAGGFRDAHIRLGENRWLPQHADRWPGIAMRWNGSAYAVAKAVPGAGEKLPPPGAVLISCDGQPAEALARRRLDRVFANLDLNGRVWTAPLLLWDLGNPFAGPDLRRCTFKAGASTRTYGLRYRPIGEREALAAIGGKPTPKSPLEVVPWGANRWWIGIPTFGDADWKGFFDKVSKNLPQLRAATTVVIDLRGNGGGNSAYASQLAQRLYGDELILARAPDLGPIVYRVSKVNRATYADYLARARREGYDADTLASLEKIVGQFDSALATGASRFQIDNDPLQRPAKTPVNPMKGRVILLTDGVCSSACLDAMDLFLAMPDTVQAGTKTGADTIFMDISQVDLPSGVFSVLYGHKAWVKRPRGWNVPYVPAPRWTYRGDIHDDAAWKSWLEKRLAS